MADTKSEKKGLYYKVECREDALKLIKESTNLWYIIAVIIFAVNLGFGSPGSFLIHPVLWALVATGVRFLFSKVAAVTLFLLALFWAYLLFSGQVEFSFIDVIVTIVMIWAAVRAIEATFLLTGQFAEPDNGIK